MLARATILASVLEDLPYGDNRVHPSSDSGAAAPQRLAFSYRLRAHDKARVAQMRRLVLNAMKPKRVMLIRQAENNQRLAHACGTVRFGVDPADSVLDANNRAHGIANLYVVDSSFFPSSGGTNPALTIAANALRVAARIGVGDTA